MRTCCVRFKKLEDVPLEVVGPPQAIKRIPAKKFIAMYEEALGPEKLAKRKAKSGAKGKKSIAS